MRIVALMMVFALFAGCSRYVSALRRDEQTNKVIGGIMRYPQGFQDDMVRDQRAAMREARTLCAADETAEKVRGFDGVGVYGVPGFAANQANSEFFEFRCVPKQVRMIVPEKPKQTDEPLCSEADRAERRKAGMSESAIERACQ